MEVLNTDPRQLSPLNLAFIGDCVYEMQVRCHLVALAKSVKFVSAKAQTAAFARMEPLLTEKELAVFKRGRNAKTGHQPKSATVGEYHCATGVEALFGYLYLTGKMERIEELFAVIFQKGE